MGLAWTPDQVKIYNLLAEGKTNKEVVAAGFDKGLVSKVKVAMKAGETPPERKPPTPTPAFQKPKISGEEGENILSVVAGYETEDVALLFIFDPISKKVIEFRHKYPEAVPMYLKCLEEPINYKGSFDQWLFSMIRSYLAALGWEFTLAPRGQGQIYNEFVRLLDEGAIKLDFDQQGNPKLEVINGDGRGKDGESKGGEGEGRGAEDDGGTGKPAETGAGASSDKIPSRTPKRGEKQPAKSK